jgi:hypothetical protein
VLFPVFLLVGGLCAHDSDMTSANDGFSAVAGVAATRSPQSTQRPTQSATQRQPKLEVSPKSQGHHVHGRTALPFSQRIRQEHLDRIALVGAVAASIGVEVTAHFERIELRVGDVDQPAMEAPASPTAKCLDPWGRGGTCFRRVHETWFSAKPVTPRLLCRLRRCRAQGS